MSMIMDEIWGDYPPSEDYAVPDGYVEGIGCFPTQGTKGEQIRYINYLLETKKTDDQQVTYCDCILSHNGLGYGGRICDCMGDDSEPTESWCFYPACSCGKEKCEPWADQLKPPEFAKMEDARGRMTMLPRA
jgi:hypothetical protein